MKQVTILMFHAIAEQQTVIDLNSRAFVDMIRRLAQQNIKGQTLTVAANRLYSDNAVDCCGLTFDDGYASVYEAALPVLAQYQFKASLFLTVGADGTIPSMNGRVMLNWRQVLELREAGFEIGAHTMTHPILSRLDATALRREIVDTQHIIEDHIGARVTTFGYPFGSYDQRSAKLVAEHYQYAVTADLRIATSADVPHLLPRIETYYLRTMPFRALVTSRYLPVYMSLRAVGRHVRSRLLLGDRT